MRDVAEQASQPCSHLSERPKLLMVAFSNCFLTCIHTPLADPGSSSLLVLIAPCILCILGGGHGLGEGGVILGGRWKMRLVSHSWTFTPPPPYVDDGLGVFFSSGFEKHMDRLYSSFPPDYPSPRFSSWGLNISAPFLTSAVFVVARFYPSYLLSRYETASPVASFWVCQRPSHRPPAWRRPQTWPRPSHCSLESKPAPTSM